MGGKAALPGILGEEVPVRAHEGAHQKVPVGEEGEHNQPHLIREIGQRFSFALLPVVGRAPRPALPRRRWPPSGRVPWPHPAATGDDECGCSNVHVLRALVPGYFGVWI